MRQFALTIHFLGPHIYKFLSATFHLPPVRSLLGVTKNWLVRPGLGDFILSVLKSKVRVMNFEARSCVACFNVVRLKPRLFYYRDSDYVTGFCAAGERRYEPATSALVVTVRGVNFGWEQPVAYFFVNSSRKELVYECVSKLTKIGLNIVAAVCDRRIDFGVDREKPYFFVGGRKIYFMHDVDCLLKSTRDGLFDRKFSFGDGCTDKKYIESFYENDRNVPYRLVKLTDRHINPNGLDKTNVRLAADVLSGTVARAMSTYISLGALPDSALPTVEFIDSVDKLYDIFTTNKFVGSESQIDFLKRTTVKFSKITITKRNVDAPKTLKFITAWRTNIESLLQMWHDLRLSAGKTHFDHPTRRQTPARFATSFKQSFCRNYFLSCERTNCIENFDELLSTMPKDATKTFYDFRTVFEGNKPSTRNSTIDTDYTAMDFSGNDFRRVCGYLLKKSLTQHDCSICSSYSKEMEALNDNDTFGNLVTLSDTFMDFVHNLELKFCEFFPVFAVRDDVGRRMEEEMGSVRFDHPCGKFPRGYVVSLFVRVRIFYTLKFANRDMKCQKSDKKKPKLAVLEHM